MGTPSIAHRSMRRSNACSAKILAMIELRSLAMGSQRVRTLVSKGYRAHAMLEMLNSLERESQWVDLNTRHKLISHWPPSFHLLHGHMWVH